MSKNLKALDSWLDLDTWHSGHSLDEERFHRAIYILLKSNKPNSVTPDDVLNYINERFHGKIEESFLRSRAEEAAERFELLSEFFFSNKL